VSASIKAEALALSLEHSVVCFITKPRTKDTSNDFREITVAAHQSGKVITIWNFLELFAVNHFAVRKIFHKRKTVKMVVNFFQEWKFLQVHPKVRPCNAQRNCQKKPRATSQSLQGSVRMLNVKVHD